MNPISVAVTPPAKGRRRSALRTAVLGGILGMLVAGGTVGLAAPTEAAEIAAFVGILLGSILQYIIGMVGFLLLEAVKILINVASYNKIVTAPPVETGWTIVRDVTNMFFILVLLVIAFGTILGLDSWSYKNKRLSGLLVMAVVVNFSRTICGLLIDFSQVVMLTFVYGFKEAAGGNFTEAFGITNIMQMDEKADPKEATVSIAFKIVLALLLGLIMVVISLAVVLYMIIMLVIRIVYLWLLTVMSPLAFFLKVVPGSMASGQYGEWWKKFNSQLVFGPVMAFFLWLSLVSVSDSAKLTEGFDSGRATESTGTSGGNAASEAFKDTAIQKFIIAICLLVGGAMMANQMAGATGSAAGKVAGKGASFGAKAAKTAYRGARAAGGAAGRGLMNAGIPGTKDSQTGTRLSLAGLGAGIKQRAKDSKIGQSALFNEDKRAENRELDRIRGLRAMGNDSAAASLEKDFINKRSQGIAKKNSKEDLRGIMNDESRSKVERQSAALALANKGDETLKGKGADLSKIVGGMGGSKDFELQLRQALKAAGDEDAMVMNGDQIRDKMAAAGQKGRARMLEGIDKGAELGADGKPKQTHAVDKLLSIDKADFDSKDFSNRIRKQIEDALLVASNLDANAGRKKELEAKFSELTGKSVGDSDMAARASQLMANMEGKLTSAKLAAAASGGMQYSSVDRAAGDLLSDDPRSQKQLDRVKNMQAKLAGGEPLTDDDRAEMMDVADSLKFVGMERGLDKAPDVRDAEGRRMDGGSIVEASEIFKNLQNASSAADSKAAAESLKAAALALEDSARRSSMTPAARQEYAQAVQQGSSGLQRANGGFDKALGAGTGKEKLSAAHKASSVATASIDIMIKQAGSSLAPNLKAELEGLKRELQSIKKMKSIDESATNTLKEIQKKMTLAQKKLS